MINRLLAHFSKLLNSFIQEGYIDSSIRELDLSYLPSFDMMDGLPSPQNFYDNDGHYFFYTKGRLFLWVGMGSIRPLSDDSAADWRLCQSKNGLRSGGPDPSFFCGEYMWPYKWSGGRKFRSQHIFREDSWNVMSGNSIPNPFYIFFKDFSIDLKDFSSLTKLSLENNGGIRDEQLKSIPQLTSLDLSRNCAITNTGLSYLLKLKILNLNSNKRITGDGLRHLTNLEELNLMRSPIEINALLPFKKLQKLTVHDRHRNDISESIHLPSLRKLYIISRGGEPDCQIAIDFADSLFLYAESKNEEHNNLKLLELKNEYRSLLTPITMLFSKIKSKLFDENTEATLTFKSLKNLRKEFLKVHEGDYGHKKVFYK